MVIYEPHWMERPAYLYFGNIVVTNEGIFDQSSEKPLYRHILGSYRNFQKYQQIEQWAERFHWLASMGWKP